jgi:predicted nucleic acid-binding protein
MVAVIVDSSVLLDVLTEDEDWFSWSADALISAADRGVLVINPVVYAEVSVRFSRIEDLENALARTMLERETIPWEAAFIAGKCFREYRRRGGQRRSPLPDFFIGAHAVVRGYQVLTRDAGRFRSYFPGLKVVSPD